jgi:hypothetical protein
MQEIGIKEYTQYELLKQIEKKLDDIIRLLKPKPKPLTLSETYVLATSTQEKELRVPVSYKGKRIGWEWLWFRNNDDTNSVYISINGDDAETGFKLEPNTDKTIAYAKLNVEFIKYKAVSGTPELVVVALRPKDE